MRPFALVVRATALAAAATLVVHLALAQAPSAGRSGTLTRVGAAAVTGDSTGVALAGAHAYVTTAEGLSVVDVRDPANPRQVAIHRPQVTAPTYQRSPFVDGGYAYFLTAQSASCGNFGCTDNPDNGLRVVDVSNPADPRAVGFLRLPGLASQVVVADRRAYVADLHGGLHVVDVSDPRSPRRLATLQPGGFWPGGGAFAGTHAYVTGSTIFLVADVSDPTRPVEVGRTALAAYGGDPAVRDGVAYVAATSSGGFLTVDVTDPAHPRAVAWVPIRDSFGLGIATTDRFVFQALDGAGVHALALCDRFCPNDVAAYYPPPPADPSVAARSVDVAVAGDLVFLVVGLWHASELQVLRFTPPTAPCGQLLPSVPKGVGLVG